ncbi:MAG: flagellin lysine-N-methylase [Clostridia bacterium]|nr:flagellin lysine-N-methylase [Clostridia bacterium]
MKLSVPAYYKSFKCIADRCRHSCCVGWEIDIDSVTMKKYRTLSDGYGKNILESIEGDEPHFRLCEDERCTHLDERGLCRIISCFGDEYLCHICRAHPRFYNDTVRGKEAGLGLSCEEAARIILSRDDYDKMIGIDEFCPQDEWECPDTDFDAAVHRERIYSILSADAPYPKRLSYICDEFKVSPAALPGEEWCEVLSSLEYLNEEHRRLFFCYSSDLETPEKAEDYLRRALSYFVYRHCSGAGSEEKFRISLGFSLFCERLLSSMVREYKADTFEKICELARVISEEIEYSEDNTESIKDIFYFV